MIKTLHLSNPSSLSAEQNLQSLKMTAELNKDSEGLQIAVRILKTNDVIKSLEYSQERHAARHYKIAEFSRKHMNYKCPWEDDKKSSGSANLKYNSHPWQQREN